MTLPDRSPEERIVSLPTDRTYLQRVQYRTSANLDARASLHRRFSTAGIGWFEWLRAQMGLVDGLAVLEIGGGPGKLWTKPAAPLPAGIHVCCSDFSIGMVREAKGASAGDSRFGFTTVDVQAIPFPAGSFDTVIANHMLYHVPDLARAAAEIARVLKPGGKLYSATNGQRHLQELHDLVSAFSPAYSGRASIAGRFDLEDASERLIPPFRSVEVRRLPDSLWVTETRPLVDYVRSMWGTDAAVSEASAPAFEALVQARIDADGGIHITKDMGLVVAER